MTEDAPLDWRTVWIVGASSGLGLELAKLLDGRVSTVAVSARSEDSLKALQAKSRTVAAYPLDVTDEEAVARCVREIETAHRPIDLVVLSAGTWEIVSPPDLDVNAFRKSMEVNFMGVVNVLAHVLPAMTSRGEGQVAIVASVAGYRGLPKAAAYGPTKAALINLAESLRPELAAQGVAVSIVNPGFVDTPMTASNEFPMPFLMPADVAAGRLLSGLANKDYEIVFPRRLAWGMKALRLMPNVLFLWVVRKFMLKS
jgi:short-subunit dehydrogenase